MLLPCGFTPVDVFVLWHMLNHDEMNKLSQLSIYIIFTTRVTCLGSVPVYVAQGFRIVNQDVSPMFSNLA
jgi:hypothetical protein